MGEVIGDLDRQWVELGATVAFRRSFEQVTARYPVLGVLTTAAAPPRWAPGEADRVLYGLLAERAAGSQIAGRTVLQCMVPAMRAMVRRSRRHYADADELRAQTVAAMWSAIAHYDLRATTRIAMRLQGHTLTAVVGDRAPHARGRRVSRAGLVVEMPASGVGLERVIDARQEIDAEPGSVLGSTGEVLELLAWGVRTDVIDGPEARMIRRLYALDPGPSPEVRSPDVVRYAEVAAELGISQQAARQRASRAIRRLAAAVQIEARH